MRAIGEIGLLLHPIRERSIFGLLDDRALAELEPRLEVFDLSPGERLARSRGADHLDVVASGRIALISSQRSQLRFGEVAAGRSLELGSFLAGAREWQYDWVAEERTRVIRAPGDAIRSALEAKPELAEYLKRVTLNRELQKLKNDVRLFGYTGDEIRRLIVKLQRVRAEGLGQIDVPCLLIVHRGELTLDSAEAMAGASRAQCRAGDYLLWQPGGGGLKFETTPDFEAWAIPRPRMEKHAPGKAEAFLELLGGRFGAEAADDAPTSGEVSDGESRMIDLGAGEPEEEDDGLQVSDFKVEPRELARLQRKKPVFIQQHDEMDCGAACMAMVARYLGRRISLPTFRSLVHVTREGASMLALQRAAKVVGLEAIGVMSGFNGLKSLRTPMIALMQYHFVVVYRVSDEQVVVGDPARGIVHLTAEEFKKEWSKNCLLLRPTPAFAKYPESRNTYGKYLLVFRGAGGRFLEIGLLSALLFLLGLAAPLFMQFVFDHVFNQQARGMLNLAAAVVIGLNLFTGGLEWLRGYLLSHLAARMDAKFSALFMRQVFELPISFFAVRRVGDITTRLGELRKIRSFFTGQTLALVISLVSAVIYSVVLGLYSLKLLVLTWLMIPALAIFLRVMSPRLVERLRAIYKTQAKSQSVAYEHFSSGETVRAISGEVAARWRWETALWDFLKQHHRFERMDGAIDAAATGAKEAMQLVILVAAVRLYMTGDLTVGQVVAVSGLVSSVIGPVISLVSQWEGFSQVGVSFARVDDIFTAAPEERALKSHGERLRLTGDIRFENVSFQYGSELSPLVLNDVSLQITPGETVALVGRSGSGKTTLGYMVSLLYRPTKGRVLVDGQDAARLPLEDLRANVAMIIQENSIFSGTVLENICLGDPSPSLRRAVAAAIAADAHEFILRLPSGYATKLGEKGSGLSGGQRQRLNIARAFYRDPPILIMDEATSALDAVSEQSIVRSIRSRERARTTIIIAHRLNTVMHADRIVVLDKGRIVEQGSHAELLKKGGMYCALFRQQLAI